MFLSLTYYVFLIYFLSGFIYLVSDYMLSKQRYIFIKHVLRVFFFLFFWPFIFLKALRLYLKIGKYLKLEGRWQLFFTSEVSQNPTCVLLSSRKISILCGGFLISLIRGLSYFVRVLQFLKTQTAMLSKPNCQLAILFVEQQVVRAK